MSTCEDPAICQRVGRGDAMASTPPSPVPSARLRPNPIARPKSCQPASLPHDRGQHLAGRCPKREAEADLPDSSPHVEGDNRVLSDSRRSEATRQRTASGASSTPLHGPHLIGAFVILAWAVRMLTIGVRASASRKPRRIGRRNQRRALPRVSDIPAQFPHRAAQAPSGPKARRLRGPRAGSRWSPPRRPPLRLPREPLRSDAAGPRSRFDPEAIGRARAPRRGSG